MILGNQNSAKRGAVRCRMKVSRSCGVTQRLPVAYASRSAGKWRPPSRPTLCTQAAQRTQEEDAAASVTTDSPESNRVAPMKKRYWMDVDNQRAFLHKLGEELGITQPEGWYKVSRMEVERRGGKGLFKYHHSLLAVLQATHPSYPWEANRFLFKKRNTLRRSRGWWEDPANRKQFLNDLSSNELGIKEGSVTLRGGQGLFNNGRTLAAVLKEAYPEYPWDDSKFYSRPGPRKALRMYRGHWLDTDTQRRFLEDVAERLEITELSGWYGVERKAIAQAGGLRLFRYYPSLPAALKALYPSYPWDVSKFKARSIAAGMRPLGWWKSKANRRQFMDELGTRLGIKEYDDWLKIPWREEAKMLSRFYRSAEEILADLYPEHPWQFPPKTKPEPRPRGYWLNEENLMNALDSAAAAFSIQAPEDWYSVSLADLRTVGFPANVTRRELAQLLSKRHPEVEWNIVNLLRGKYAQQKRLERAVANLFPDVESIRNARQEGGLLNPATASYLELDIFFPSLNLAFEYQEMHHYAATTFMFQPLDRLEHRDDLKKRLAEERGITLIVVPCWWDGREASLVATIKEARPDLLTYLPSTAAPILREMPAGFLANNTKFHVEDIGQPITACFMTGTSVDPTNWWLFEKYDGVRGFWNPIKRAIFSRQGRRLPIAQEVIDSMPPNMFLDGELWFGRNSFQESMKISLRNGEDIDWSKFKFMVFDVPNHSGTYQQRYSQLVEALGREEHRFIGIAPKEECTGINHLEKVFQDIVDKGGEGIILRDPSSPYAPGRSPGFLKHKKFRDAEARIVGPAGKHQWECELPNGVRFIAAPGSSEFEKRWTPNEGDIVSFKHHGFLFHSKKPKLAALMRLRPDLTWKEVTENWKDKARPPTGLPFQVPKTRFRPRGFWRDPANQRQFLLRLAEHLNFDPMQPENWKHVTTAHLLEHKGGKLLSIHGTLRHALSAVFPDKDFRCLRRRRIGELTEPSANEQGGRASSAKAFSGVWT